MPRAWCRHRRCPSSTDQVGGVLVWSCPLFANKTTSSLPPAHLPHLGLSSALQYSFLSPARAVALESLLEEKRTSAVSQGVRAGDAETTEKGGQGRSPSCQEGLGGLRGTPACKRGDLESGARHSAWLSPIQAHALGAQPQEPRRQRKRSRDSSWSQPSGPCAHSVRKPDPGSLEDVRKSQTAVFRTNYSGACAGSVISLQFHYSCNEVSVGEVL